MNQQDVNRALQEIINEAQGLHIPVPSNIHREVFINPRPKKRFGCCKKKDGKFLIEVSRFLLEGEERAIRSVLAHEVLHTCRGCYEHGARWKEYAARMNQAWGYQIKRTSSFGELGLPAGEESPEERAARIKYIIKCTRCGREYPRQKVTCVMKKINAYRCSCGGKLVIIEK